jgi:hypothetical protein
MYDHYGNYTASFLVAGIPPIVGAFLMFLIYRVDGTNVSNVEIQTDELLPSENVENGGVRNVGMTESGTKTTFVAEDDNSVEKESLLKV